MPVIVRLNKSHDRSSFECGEEDLDTFLKKYARQNDNKGISTTFVLCESVSFRVLGYYSISSGQVACADLPTSASQTLPKYPIPVIRLGRLAVDRKYQGKGFGKILLADALLRCKNLADELGVYAVEVHALSSDAKRFYVKYGFQELQDDEWHLYMSMKSVRKLEATRRA